MVTKKKATSAGDRVIEYRPLNELEGDSRNPKEHDLELLDQSVARFGFVEPITVDGRTGRIVAGHGRAAALRAMQERGDEAPAGVQQEGETWSVPVVTGWASANDTEASAALIALNRTSEVGGWVDASLLGLLEELSGQEGDFSGIGFDDEDMQRLQERVEQAENLEMFDGLGSAEPTAFNTNEGWEDPQQSELVEFKLPMSAEQRSTILSGLNAVKDQHALETLADALLHVIKEAAVHG